MTTTMSASVAITGMIAFGTISSLLAKLIYSLEAESRFGGSERFEKPWFQVLAMFIGMSLSMLLEPSKRRYHTGSDLESQPLLPESDHVSRSSVVGPSIWVLGLPSLLDLFATACGTTGLLYTTVSVYQMLRGTMLVWTALMSVVILRRQLSVIEWAGLALCVSGTVLVGAANIVSEGTGVERQNVMIGVAIILVGQFLQAGQVVMEEHLLADMQMSSVRIVGWEGVFGVAHCIVWVFPLVMLLPGRDHGRLEDVADALYMVVHSWKVAAVVLSDMALMLGCNVCGMAVTENLSAVHRVVIETLRTFFVWVIDLILYYMVSNGQVGEKWTSFSLVQLVGFALLIVGTMTYNYQGLTLRSPSPTREHGNAQLNDETHSKDIHRLDRVVC